MKEKLTRNIGLKLLSLALALLLWIAVINSQDPMETVKFENIPVMTINEDALTAKDKIPEIVEGDTVTVIIEARRSICEQLTEEDIIAVADFGKISLTDAVPIDISVKGYSERDVEVIRGMNQVMKLRLEDYEAKEFRVKVTTTGTTADGYVVGDMIASPNMITVSGSKTQISKIKEIVLAVDVEGVSADLTTTAVPIIYDGNGDIVSTTRITLSTEQVAVKVPVLQTKQVRLRVYSEGAVTEGYELASISYQPETVMIAGTAEDLAKIGSSLSAYCNITGRTGVIEENIDITSLWDTSLTSLRLVEEDDLLAITIHVNEYEQKEIELPDDNISFRNLPEGLEAVIETISDKQIKLKGPKNRLLSITVERLAPYINLEGYTETGTYVVPVEFTTVSGMTVVNEIMATIHIMLAEQEAPLSAGE